MSCKWDKDDDSSDGGSDVAKDLSGPEAPEPSRKKAKKDSVSSNISLSEEVVLEKKRVEKKEAEDNNHIFAKINPLKAAAHNPLIHGCRSVDCYERLNFIDQGSFGVVFRAKCNDTGGIYALKQVKVPKEQSNKLGFPITALREANILLTLNHPNIVKVREMVIGSSIDKVYMVMEFLGKDLKETMHLLSERGMGALSRESGTRRGASNPPFSSAEVKLLLQQLLSATAHMHKLWYLHRDLKTANLLYTQEQGKLTVCDFGLARKYGSPLRPYTFEVVTLWYRCPSLLLGQQIYSTAIDVWSIGCIFGEMLTGNPLFPGQGEVDQLNQICSLLGIPDESSWPGVSKLSNWAPLGNQLARASGSTSTGYDQSDPRRFERFHREEGSKKSKSKTAPPTSLNSRTTPLQGVRSQFSHNSTSKPGANKRSKVLLSDAGCKLMAAMLELDPSKRISAGE